MNATTIRRLALAGVLLGFVVVVLGAYVRLTAAGLGCPDWPGCYGHFTPIGAQAAGPEHALEHGRPLEAGKAWREMIHRYAAAALGLIVLVIAVLAWRARAQRIVALPFAFGLLALIMVQGALGAFTVTLLLKPLIVTLHLIFGFSTVALLWWLWLTLARRSGTSRWSRASLAFRGSQLDSTLTGGASSGMNTGRGLVILAICALTMQIALGGWTSSNYAAVACPDFPRCQASWWPEADYADAFVLWRGLGINYEGGVLDHPARVAIHFAHRLGALLASLLLLIAAVRVLAAGASGGARVAAWAVLAGLLLQLCIGIGMVEKGFPLWLATAHNAGAALLLLCGVGLLSTMRK
ncbi:MAG: COX15/CtaA family protein [Steroidobacteraceae bacterium]